MSCRPRSLSGLLPSNPRHCRTLPDLGTPKLCSRQSWMPPLNPTDTKGSSEAILLKKSRPRTGWVSSPKNRRAQAPQTRLHGANSKSGHCPRYCLAQNFRPILSTAFFKCIELGFKQRLVCFDSARWFEVVSSAERWCRVEPEVGFLA